MPDPFNLQRFVDAQAPVYETVVRELAEGQKRSHWMWFVFPQIAGLGFSPTSVFFAIASLDEAKAYLAHPVLGPRLVECAGLVLRAEGRTARIRRAAARGRGEVLLVDDSLFEGRAGAGRVRGLPAKILRWRAGRGDPREAAGRLKRREASRGGRRRLSGSPGQAAAVRVRLRRRVRPSPRRPAPRIIIAQVGASGAAA